MHHGLTNREDPKITRHLQVLTRSPGKRELSLPPDPGRALTRGYTPLVRPPGLGQRGEKLPFPWRTCEALRVTCDFWILPLRQAIIHLFLSYSTRDST